MADSIDQAVNLANGVLTRAGMAWRDVANLVLWAGATRMPLRPAGSSS